MQTTRAGALLAASHLGIVIDKRKCTILSRRWSAARAPTLRVVATLARPRAAPRQAPAASVVGVLVGNEACPELDHVFGARDVTLVHRAFVCDGRAFKEIIVVLTTVSRPTSGRTA